MTWHHGPLLAFDVESTGVDVESDRIVTACVALIDGTGQRPVESMTWLINPGVDIPQGATDIHGITNEHAAQYGRSPGRCIPEIAERLAQLAAEHRAPIVAFNACYDLTILDRECRRNEVAGGVTTPVIDPFVLDKHVDQFRRGSRKLVDQCTHYGVRIDQAHDAAADAVAAARVAWKIAAQHPQIAEMGLRELHALQVKAKAEQDASFATYLRSQARQAKDVDEQIDLNRRADGITGHWPVTPYAEQEVTVR